MIHALLEGATEVLVHDSALLFYFCLDILLNITIDIEENLLPQVHWHQTPIEPY